MRRLGQTVKRTRRRKQRCSRANRKPAWFYVFTCASVKAGTGCKMQPKRSNTLPLSPPARPPFCVPRRPQRPRPPATTKSDSRNTGKGETQQQRTSPPCAKRNQQECYGGDGEKVVGGEGRGGNGRATATNHGDSRMGNVGYRHVLPFPMQWRELKPLRLLSCACAYVKRNACNLLAYPC